MSVRYSYGDFTTRGHGVIEYADPYSNQDGQKKRKRHKKVFATRWPSAEPLKAKSPASNAVTKIPAQMEKMKALEVFKQRHPGQKPNIRQIKQIMKELGLKPQKVQVIKPVSSIKTPSLVARQENTLDKLAKAMFERRFPGQEPKKGQLAVISREIADARRKMGL